MNNIFKALLGTTYKAVNPSPVSQLQKPQVLIDINPKPPRKPRKSTVKTQVKTKKDEEQITEKEIQAAMKRIKKVEAEARKRLAEEELQNTVPKKSDKTTKNPKSEAPKKKQPIPNHVKTLIWNHWVGCDKAETYCLC